MRQAGKQTLVNRVTLTDMPVSIFSFSALLTRRGYVYFDTLSRIFLTKLLHTQNQRHITTDSTKLQDTRPPKHRQQRNDYLKLMNNTMTVDEDKVEATVRSVGLTFSDYDSKNSLPKPWHLMKLLEGTRFYAHHWPLDDSGRVFRDYSRLTDDRLIFLATSSMDINKALYDPKIPKSPVDIKIQGGYIGNTSLNSIATVFTTNGDKLLSNVNHVVTIDQSSRKPKSLPDWWKEKYAKSAKSHGPLKLTVFQKPDDLDPYTMKVARSDLDGNNHANWSSYVRFSVDGMYDFAKRGLLKSFSDFDDRYMSRMELTFSGESFDGDTLDILAWEHNESAIIVHIVKQQQLLFQGHFLYYPSESTAEGDNSA